MKDRIRQLMEAQHMNQQAFSIATGIGSASLSSIFTGRTNPTLNHVEAILNKFPQVNPMWLLKGVGGMMLSASETENSIPSDSNLTGVTPADEDAISGLGVDGAQSGASANVAVQPTLFDTPQQNPSSSYNRVSSQRSARSGFRMEAQQQVVGSQGAYHGQQQQVPPVQIRKITEIRVFYDDQTWESFTPRTK